jgi:hypothetical protein
MIRTSDLVYYTSDFEIQLILGAERVCPSLGVIPGSALLSAIQLRRRPGNHNPDRWFWLPSLREGAPRNDVAQIGFFQNSSLRRNPCMSW